MKRIKTITSYAGHARFCAELTETGKYLARVQCEDIPSPYRYSPSIEINRYHGRDVVWFETRHRRYEVFEVPKELLRFPSDEAATDWHIRFSKHAA